jgi:hypothetical protein
MDLKIKKEKVFEIYSDIRIKSLFEKLHDNCSQNQQFGYIPLKQPSNSSA